MKKCDSTPYKKNYAPSQTAINELTDLLSRGITDINHQSIKNSKFYKEIQTATTLLILNDRTVPPKVLLLIAQIAATSTILHDVRMYGDELGENSEAIATALTKSHTIWDVTISYKFIKYPLKIAEAFTRAAVLDRFNMNGSNLTEKTANVFIKHNDKCFDTLSTMAHKLNAFMPQGVINLVSSYLPSFIKYSINHDMKGNYKCSMHGNSKCDLNGHNWNVKKFKDESGGYIWRPMILHKGKYANKHLIEHINSNGKKSVPIETTTTKSSALDTTKSESLSDHNQAVSTFLSSSPSNLSHLPNEPYNPFNSAVSFSNGITTSGEPNGYTNTIIPNIPALCALTVGLMALVADTQ